LKGIELSAAVPQTALEATIVRLHGYVRAIEGRWPGVWGIIDKARAGRGRNGDAGWPAWCYVPLAGTLEIANRYGELEATEYSEVGVIGALSAWRLTKGLYQFDPTLLKALWETPIKSDADLPADVFYRLPEWCVYITTPGYRMDDGTSLLGFFAHLDYEWDGRAQLRVYLDTGIAGRDLVSIGMYLMHREVSRCIDAAFEDAKIQAALHRDRQRLGEEIERARSISESVLPSVLSLLAYLSIAIQSREIRDSSGTDRLPRRPQGVRVKKGLRIFAPERPSVWSVGYRIGPALRAALEKSAAEKRRGGFTVEDRRSPHGHIRRAHWHTYWTGPWREPEKQEALVKWLPPLPINLEFGAEAPVTTVYPVRAPL
jgi:hypothetical protein